MSKTGERSFSNLKGIIKENGVLLLTTRSPGFAYHGYPHDFWRYTPEDMRVIFSDMSIEALESDPSSAGVFVRVRKPSAYAPRPLGEIRLTSVLPVGRRLQAPPRIVRDAYALTVSIYRKSRYLVLSARRSAD